MHLALNGRRLVAAAALVAALMAALVALSTSPAPAGAATTTLATGGLDWGVKQSFRSYIAGPIAHGSIELGGGATTNPDGSFHFPLAGGSFDDETAATVASFAGSVHFSGHAGALDLRISDVRVELTADGSRLIADMESVPYPAGSAPVVYADTELATLDLSGVDPVVDAGTTAWSAIPATLATAGAGAFGTFYSAGTPLDPVSLSYEGPGGKPIAEQWTAPGTPLVEQLASTTVGGIYCGLFPDPARGVLHAVHSNGVTAFDLDTLATVDVHPVTGQQQFGCAFDPETGTLFGRLATGNVLAYSYSAGQYSDLPEVPIAGQRTLDYDTATDKLWAIGTRAPAPSFGGNPTVEVATRSGSGWTAQAYPAIETGGRNISGIARAGDGTLVASYYALLVSGALVPNATATLTDTGSALVATDVAGTVSGPNPGGGNSLGYAFPHAAPDGSVLLREVAYGAPSTRLLRLTPDGAAAAGYSVAGQAFDVGAPIGHMSFDLEDGTLYAYTQDDRLLLLRGDGAPTVAASKDGLAGSEVFGGVGKAYVAGGGGLAVYDETALSPEVDAQPEDVTLELPSATATAAATLTSAAIGTPAPTVRWQRRAPGVAAWEDIAGADSGTLAVDASAAVSGTRYRALFENAGGTIASDAATLTVKVVPPAEEEPPGGEQPRHDDRPRVDPPRTGPPVAAPPARRAARRPLVRSPRAAVAVGSRRVAKVATVRCRGAAGCRLTVPRFARVTIEGDRYRARVLAPRRIPAGRTAAVRIRLGRALARRLDGRRGAARLRIVSHSGDQRASAVVRVALRS